MMHEVVHEWCLNKAFFKLMAQCIGVFANAKRAVFLWYNSGYFLE